MGYRLKNFLVVSIVSICSLVSSTAQARPVVTATIADGLLGVHLELHSIVLEDERGDEYVAFPPLEAEAVIFILTKKVPALMDTVHQLEDKAELQTANLGLQNTIINNQKVIVDQKTEMATQWKAAAESASPGFFENIINSKVLWYGLGVVTGAVLWKYLGPK